MLLLAKSAVTHDQQIDRNCTVWGLQNWMFSQSCKFKLTSWQPNQLCIESDKCTFFSSATQAAFILGNFVHLYKAYLHFLNISEQYLFRNTSCTKRFNFRKSLKKPQKVSNLARKMWFCWCTAILGHILNIWNSRQLSHIYCTI